MCVRVNYFLSFLIIFMFICFIFFFFFILFFLFCFFFFFQAEDGIRDLTVTGVQTCALPIYYFKKDAIPMAWELLTTVWHLDADRLFPSVFKGEGGIPRDDESFGIWMSLVPPTRIVSLGLGDNFWSMGETGPCGRCSEIYYFRGDDIPCDEPVCRGVECSCDRYVEIWNNVFMEFDRQADGTLKPLPALSVDTGMGLERITSVIQGKLATYDTDLFTPILDAIGRGAGRAYTGHPGGGDHPDVSMRVIADHLRAMTFLIADGVLPSNEWRGYVLRKIMRRAMRHGKKLGFAEPFLHGLVDVVVGEMGPAYPELASGRDSIVRTVRAEEERFDAVLTSGLPRLEELIDRTVAAGQRVVPGDEVFRLYDSLGVPYDFAEDLAAQRNLAIDRQAYDAAMEGQRDRARASSKFAGGPAGQKIEHPGADQFTGYDRVVEENADVIAVYPDGEHLLVFLSRTPFYVEAGGQVSDSGTLRGPDFEGDVVTVRKGSAGTMRAHVVAPRRGQLEVGDKVTATVDASRRDATRRNHTATHLLHAALRQRLGTHVQQKGSLVAPDRLRFDFAHFSALTSAERREIERAVNEQVFLNTTVRTEERSTDDAIK